MIHSLWILRNTVLIFHQDWGKFDIQDDLFSGLLSALNIVARETIGERLHNIVMENFKFVFDKNGDYYFVICADKEDNNLLLHKKLVRVQIHFLHEFHDRLPNWNGEVAIFNKFNEKSSNIINSHPQGTILNCDICEKVIEDEFLSKKIGKHDFCFCSEMCEQHFESWYSTFIENLNSYLNKHQIKKQSK